MDNLTGMLTAVLMILIFVVVVLVVIFISLKVKEKNNEKETEKSVTSKTDNGSSVPKKNKIAKEYEEKSIFDFMEFEDIKDNMIIQKGGKKFLMAIECQGINYDLMSDVEKASTEQGFSIFLNTLKEPIQIYIQTRKVNLEKNIQNYQARLNKIRDQLNLKEYRLKQYKEQEYKDEQTLKDKEVEVLRERNLYGYGKDIITDTKRMSLNKNVLKKKYYIILKYFYEPTDYSGEETFLSDEEITEIAFSNLYTKAVSMIRVLAGIGIVGKTLNSYELVDLLYNAYNRDDSEVFGIEKAIEAGFNEIYIDSQSVIDKKIEALNKEIQIRAQREAENAVKDIKNERDKELLEIEENLDEIIMQLAKELIEDENNNLPTDTREKAVKNIEKKTKEKLEKKTQEKGEKENNGEKQTSRKRRAG